MSLTFAQFAAELNAMPIVGVVTKYTGSPDALDSAALPAQWPRIVSAGNEIISFDGCSSIDSHSIDLVFLVEFSTAEDGQVNFDAAVAIIDNVKDALKAEMLANKHVDRWTITQDRAITGDWVLVATVEGSG